MVESNIVDEVYKIKNYKCEEEIVKFYVNEELSETDKITFIIKKGFSIQKGALIKNLPRNLNNKDLTEFIIQSLLEYIEIWDEALQIDFSNSIFKMFFVNSIAEIYNEDFYFNDNNEHLLFINIKEAEQKNILTIYYNTQDIINPLLKFFMKIICSTDDRNIVTLEYIRTFSIIVKFFCYYKKIKVDNDVIDFACNLGTFGKSVLSRRYCVFFCSSLIQISENYNSELFNRFMILSSDSDRIIRIETAFNLRFICKELEENFIKRNLLKTIENYLSEEEPIIKTEVFNSVICNFKKFFFDDSNLGFLTLLLIKITQFMENSNNYNMVYKIYAIIVNEYFDGLKEYNNFSASNYNSGNGQSNVSSANNSNKSFLNIIKIFLRRFVLAVSNIPEEQLVYDILSNYTGLMKIIDYHKEHQLTYEIINFILSKTENSILSNLLFFHNIIKIIKSVPNDVKKKLIFPKLFNSINNNISYLFPIIINNFDLLFEATKNNDELKENLIDHIENFLNIFKSLNINFNNLINLNLNILNSNLMNTIQTNNPGKQLSINLSMVSNGNISLINHNQFLWNINLLEKNPIVFFNNNSNDNPLLQRKNSFGYSGSLASGVISANQMKQQFNNMHNRSNANYNRNSNGNYSFTINLNNPSSNFNNNNNNNNNSNSGNLNSNNLNPNYLSGFNSSNNNSTNTNSNNNSNNNNSANLNKSNLSNDNSENGNSISNFINDSFAIKQPFLVCVYEITKILSQSVWRILINFLEKIKKSEFLFTSTDFTSKIFIFITKIIKDENLNIPAHQALIEIFPFLIKYGLKSEKDEINRILLREIIESKSFYQRRLFFPYFQSALSVFSISFLIHNHTIENFIKLLDDNNLMKAKCIVIFKDFYPLLVNDTKIKPHLENKLEEIKKVIPIDYEIKRKIDEFEEWLVIYQNNQESEEYLQMQEKDKEKRESEKFILIKEQKILNERKNELRRLKKIPLKKNTVIGKINPGDPAQITKKYFHNRNKEKDSPTKNPNTTNNSMISNNVLMRSNTLTNIPLLGSSKSNFYKENQNTHSKIIINDTGKKDEHSLNKIHNSPNSNSNINLNNTNYANNKKDNNSNNNHNSNNIISNNNFIHNNHSNSKINSHNNYNSQGNSHGSNYNMNNPNHHSSSNNITSNNLHTTHNNIGTHANNSNTNNNGMMNQSRYNNFNKRANYIINSLDGRNNSQRHLIANHPNQASIHVKNPQMNSMDNRSSVPKNQNFGYNSKNANNNIINANSHDIIEISGKQDYSSNKYINTRKNVIGNSNIQNDSTGIYNSNSNLISNNNFISNINQNINNNFINNNNGNNNIKNYNSEKLDNRNFPLNKNNQNYNFNMKGIHSFNINVITQTVNNNPNGKHSAASYPMPVNRNSGVNNNNNFNLNKNMNGLGVNHFSGQTGMQGNFPMKRRK